MSPRYVASFDVAPQPLSGGCESDGTYAARDEERKRQPERRLTYLLGQHFGTVFGLHGASVHTAIRSLVSRVFVSKYREDGARGPPIAPGYRRVIRGLEAFTRAAKPHLGHVPAMTEKEFLDTCGRKRKVYEAAAEQLQHYGLRPRDWEISMFVKAEKLNLSAKPDPDPRAIQPRGPAYNLLVGRYLRPMEKRIYRVIKHVFGEVTVYKGMNALQQGALTATKWSKFRDPVAFGLDLHRMDQHVSHSLLKWEHSVYRRFNRDKALAKLLEKQLVNRGRCYTHDGKIKYWVRGRRMSGDMNTGLGNCLIMCAAIYAALDAIGAAPCHWADQAIRQPAYELMNNGDDCVIMCERGDAERFKTQCVEYLKELGLPLGVEDTVDTLEHVEFCQTRPVYDGTRWTMVRDPRVCLSKDSCTVKPVRTQRDWNTLRNTIGLSGLALAGHMPVYCEFYELLRRGAGERVDKDTTPSGFSMLAKGMNMSGVEVTDAARVSFFTAFDINPAEQRLLEGRFRLAVPRWGVPSQFGRHHVDDVVARIMGLLA